MSPTDIPKDTLTAQGGAGAAGAAAGAEAALPLPARLKRFLDERFPLQVHGISILVFFVTNAAVAQAATTVAGTRIQLGGRSALAALALGLMFLRLRLFDEVKDYDHDRVHNPARPLPRGLLTPREVNVWAAITAAIEAGIAAFLGPAAVAAWAAAFGFTVLMRLEFFMREAIRPRLLTYAILHTPSGGLFGLFVFSATTGVHFWQAPRAMWLYAGAGWSLLMLFEVARKTADPRLQPGPDTYSTVFGAKGAAALNAAFVVGSTLLILLAVLDALGSPVPIFAYAMWGLTAIALSTILAYGRAPSPRSAILLRLAAQLYLALSGFLSAGAILYVRGVRFGG